MDLLLIIAAVAIVVEGLGIWLAVDAIGRGRTPQGAFAWALALIFVPPIAIPLYLLFGARRLDGYVRARRRGQIGLDQLAQNANDAIRPWRIDMPLVEREHKGAMQIVADRLTTTSWTHGNRTTLLVDAHATYDALESALDSATQQACVQFYIVRSDAVGQRLQSAMLRAAARGVKVLFLVDDVGSLALAHKYIEGLERGGVQCARFSPRRILNPFHLNFRNHRKVVVVDGHTALVGGTHIGSAHLGADPAFGQWRDTHVQIEGPAALAAQLAFCEDWNWAAGQVPTLQWEAVERGSDRVLIVPTGPADELETCALMFHQAIHHARSRFWIATPYFVPDEAIVTSLQLARLRGVDVRILIPDDCRNALVQRSTFSYYEEVLGAGIGLYRYQPAFLHHKVFLSDDIVGLGTAN
ncbi:MAG: phospholipase D-like domain-containing protein, partial [Planctomycetota bacterium]